MIANSWAICLVIAGIIISLIASIAHDRKRKRLTDEAIRKSQEVRSWMSALSNGGNIDASNPDRPSHLRDHS